MKRNRGRFHRGGDEVKEPEEAVGGGEGMRWNSIASFLPSVGKKECASSASPKCGWNDLIRDEKERCCCAPNEVFMLRLSDEVGVMGTSSGVGGQCIDELEDVGLNASLLRSFWLRRKEEDRLT